MKTRMFLLILFICYLGVAKAQMSQQMKDNSLSVKGMAILKATPELLTVRIDLDSEAENYNVCQEELLHKIEETKSVFVNNGIQKKSIFTLKLNISEKKVYKTDKSDKTLFAGHGSLLIENSYNEEYARKVVTSLRAASISVHYALYFSLSENQKAELRKKAIEVALADAREKANFIALGADIRLLKINSINYSDTEFVGYSTDNDLVREIVSGEQAVYANSEVADPGSAVINFNPREIGIKKVMTVEWLIEDKK